MLLSPSTLANNRTCRHIVFSDWKRYVERCLFFAGFVFLSTATLHVAAAENPERSVIEGATRVVARLHDTLGELGTESEADVDRRYEMLAPVITATHDLPYIARFVLRRSWKDLSPNQQASFSQLFETLSIMNYASRFAGLDRDALRILHAEHLGASRAQVIASLSTADDRTVALSYTLHLKGEEWRIINIIADGVSDLALRRSEYTRLLENDGFTGLVSHIETQIADLR